MCKAVKVTDDKLVNYVNKDGSTSQTKVLLIPQATPPTHSEGQLYYSEALHNMAFQTDIVGVEVGVGQLPLRVINRGVATLLKGKPLRHDGVDITTGLARVALAQADTLDNAFIIGIAAHDIAPNDEGMVFNDGVLVGIDTSALATGVPVFLSATVAGGLTTTRPDILTQAGGVLVSDASVGSLFILIDNTIARPVELGALGDNTQQIYNLTATNTNIQNYTLFDGVVSEVDNTAGTITLIDAGWYEMVFSMTGTVDSEEEDLIWEIYDITNDVVLGTKTINSGRSSTPTNVAYSPTMLSLIEVLTDNTEIIVRVKTDGTAVELSIDSMQFYTKSLHLK